MSLRERLDDLEYPREYPFKLVFQARSSLAAEVESQLRQVLGADRHWKLNLQPSRTGKYVSLTVSLQVCSAEEVEQLHRHLAALPGVLVQL
jgi:putative lipoic acid-binding regulatory protein